jgi:hypothetical protein
MSNNSRSSLCETIRKDESGEERRMHELAEKISALGDPIASRMALEYLELVLNFYGHSHEKHRRK